MGIISILAIVVLCSVSVSVLASDANDVTIGATVLNSAPSVDVELTPDDDLVTPGVQVINPEPTTMNKTVTIIANVTDMNGYDDLTGVVIATVTGPSVIEESPVNLSFDTVVNVTTVVYTGSFNMSNHSEGDYKVEVTATDNGGLISVGSKNFTYLYGTPVVIVTTYDFATGAGSDKWAYRKQHNAKPPVTNDVPSIEFKSREYGRISKDDRKVQRDSTRLNGYYAVHRFKFDITQPVGSIVEIAVLWTGAGTHADKEAVQGATLYLWNFNSGAYEQLNITSSKKEVYLTGMITENVGNYIDTTGNLTILVEQNSPQGGKASKISTDYVKVDITYLSLSASMSTSTSTTTAVSEASTAEETVNSLLDRVQQGGISLFRWLFGEE